MAKGRSQKASRVSRTQTGKLVLRYTAGVNLVGLIRQVLEQEIPASPNHTLVLDAPEEGILAEVDEGRLEQVLNNLVSNAVKYSPDGSRIVVGIRPQEPAEVLIWVKDSGRGISHQHLEHIFERFYRAGTPENQAVEGLGLGLYISHRIVNLHGGRLRVESSPDKGSTFSFSLPRTRPAPPPGRE